MQDAYTRVLMGQIELATTVWPAGLYGTLITRNSHIELVRSYVEPTSSVI